MIKLYNRKTKDYEIEKVAGEGFMKAIYGNSIGKVGLELLIKRKFYSFLMGLVCDMKISSKKISSFIQDFDIDMSICPNEIRDFKNFNEFFTRKVKETARPFEREADKLLAPGDGRLKVWNNIDMEKVIQVKGLTYSLVDLVGDRKLAQKYQGGICVLLRLAPVDYHRFHFVDSGICGETKKIKGHYYSVNPIALNTVPQVFCQNKREYSILKSDNFGDILYIEVGATSVGSIVQTYTEGARVEKGQEKGYFKFGGSTVILFLEKDVATIDDDILIQTELEYETRVLAGEKIGIKINKSFK